MGCSNAINISGGESSPPGETAAVAAAAAVNGIPAVSSSCGLEFITYYNVIYCLAAERYYLSNKLRDSSL